MDDKQPFIIGDLSGGINGSDPPLLLRENQCVDAQNLDWWHASVGRKRNGSSSVDLSFSSGGPFTGILSSLFRHVPSTDDSVAELWGVDDAATPVIGRYAPAAGSAVVDYFLLAGGGGGSVGGGGAGGTRSGSAHTVSAGTYAIVIGAGGAGSGNDVNTAANGSDSSFDGITATGGGKGGYNGTDGSNGGSGGGSGLKISGVGGTGSQGNNGGSSTNQTGSGGGGAGTAGVSNTGTGLEADGTAGGDGASTSLIGTAELYARGGGGGAASQTGVARNGGAAGSGGAGTGGTTTTAGTAAAANTGDGGGGGGYDGTASVGGVFVHAGGAGGSGKFMVRYPTGSISATGGTVTTDGAGNTTHTFTSSGNWVVVSVSVPKFVTPTLKDAPTGNGWDVTAASVNGKLFLAYKSAQDRLHVWDPVSNQVRRAGVAAMAVPTVANTGSGSYAATARYYRTRATVQIAGVTVRRSEASPSSTVFTPSGSGTAARVTQGAVPNELETHWEVEASLDNVTFYRIATVVIGTTTYDDSAATGTYNTNPLSAATGTYTLPKSYKYIAGADNRLLGFGAWTTTNKQDRIEFSAVVGSSDIGDAERIDTTNPYYTDLDENDSGTPTGLAGPVNGNYYAGKLFQLWELRPTGDINQPFAKTCLSKTVGPVGPKAMFTGEDGAGNPALYLFSVFGPYRYGAGGYEAGGSISTYAAGGLQRIGRDVEHLTLGVTTGEAVTTSALVVSPVKSIAAHGVYHVAKKKAYFWFATLANMDPDTLIELDVKGGGWTRHTGISAARCSVMFSNTVGAGMSFDKKPYLGMASAVNTVWKTDDETKTADLSAAFQSYVIPKPVAPGGPMFSGEVGDPLLLAQAASGVTITITAAGDFDPTITRSGSALLTGNGNQTRVSARCDGAGLGNVEFVSYTIGDSAAVSNAWSLDRVLIPVTKKGALTA